MRRLLQFALLLAALAWCVPAHAAIARTGTCGAVATSCTLSAVNTNDLVIVYAWRTGSTTPPTLPSGWTTIDTNNLNGSTADSFRSGCSVATSSSDTGTDTWTNATDIFAFDYSGTGVNTTADCNTTGIGAHATTGNSNGTVVYSALTLQHTDNTSFVAGLCGLGNTSNTGCNTAPTGMTNFKTVGTGPNAAGHDTNATVSSWSQQTVTITSSVWLTNMMEIKAAAAGGSACVGYKMLMGVGCK